MEKQQLNTITRQQQQQQQQHTAAGGSAAPAAATRTTSRFQVEEEVMDAADVAELQAEAAARGSGGSGTSPLKASSPPRHPRVDRLRGGGSPPKRRHGSMTVVGVH